MSQWGFYFDQTRCVGCKACVLGCKTWNDERRGDYNLNRDSMNPATDWWSDGSYQVKAGEMDKYSFYLQEDGETNYPQNRKYYMKEEWRRVSLNEYSNPLKLNCMSVACNHCADPSCITACPMQIISKEPERGIVLVDNTNCISCGKCQDACPWGAPQFYDPNFRKYAETDPLRPKMTKCTLCLDRIKEGLKPACVAACLNRALDAGPIDEIRGKWKTFGKNVQEYNVMPANEFASDSVPSQGKTTKPNILFVKKA